MTIILIADLVALSAVRNAFRLLCYCVIGIVVYINAVVIIFILDRIRRIARRFVRFVVRRILSATFLRNCLTFCFVVRLILSMVFLSSVFSPLGIFLSSVSSLLFQFVFIVRIVCQ